MLIRKHYDNREDWLNGRQSGIGASDIAAVVGMSPYMTTTDLWQLKTGMTQPKDLADNGAVSLGVSLEPVLRDMYRVLHPDYKVEHHPFDILYDDARPYITCTLDGDIVTDDGRNGVLEIKTATLRNSTSWREWQDRIPDHYLCQCTQQLAITQWDFCDLFAALIDGLTGEITIRSYHMECDAMQNDIEWLTEKGEQFWECVETKTLPSMPIRL